MCRQFGIEVLLNVSTVWHWHGLPQLSGRQSRHVTDRSDPFGGRRVSGELVRFSAQRLN